MAADLLSAARTPRTTSLGQTLKSFWDENINPPPGIVHPVVRNVINFAWLTKLIVGGGALGIVAGNAQDVYNNRDTIRSYFTELTQKGYYSPFLNTRIVYNNGKWYRVDTGTEINNNLDVSFLSSTDIRVKTPFLFDYLRAPHLTIDQSTFQSPQWQALDKNIQAKTKNDPLNIDDITKAFYNNLVFDNNLDSQLDIYSNSDRSFQNILAKNLEVCFEFASAEQAYLAERGIPSEVVTTVTPGSKHAFLAMTDKNGKKWVVDPTNGIVLDYDQYMKVSGDTDITVLPSIYSFTNPNGVPNFTIGRPTPITGFIPNILQKIKGAAQPKPI